MMPKFENVVIKRGRTPALLTALVLSTTITGCATTGNQKDPIEGFNRAVFSINDVIDSVALKPVAQFYDSTLPGPVKTGVSNFFGNVEDVFTGVNNVLQGKPGQGASDFGRVLVNTTVGVLGLFDVATELGLAKHDEDFGQTFGRWGVGNGPYVVLPIFGPKTARDTVGFAADMYVDPVGNVDHVPTRNTFSVIRVISTRAELLPADKVIEEAALDKYSYVRDGYLQRRRNLIYDGSPPRDTSGE